MAVSRAAYPDFTAWDVTSKYHDPKSTQKNPRWLMIDVTFKRKLANLISLQSLRAHPQLADMALLQRGNRLSVTSVTEKQWKYILELELSS